MDRTIEVTRDPIPQTVEASSRTDLPHSGFTLARNGAFIVPSLSRIKSAHSFATQWHALHPEIPLMPVRRQTSSLGGRRGSPKSALWVPVDGWWDGEHTSKELIRLLKNDPSLGVGLRLGRRGPGMPWFVDILVKKLQEARPALWQMLERHEIRLAATWRDQEGMHQLFVGDDRLAKFGPVVVGTNKGVGGNPPYAGLEIRLGSDDPANSFVVLPPTPLGDGRPREATGRNELTILPNRAYAALERFALATNLGADDPRSLSATPRPDEHQEPSAPRPKRPRKVVTLPTPEDLISSESTIIEVPDPEVPATITLPDFSAQATNINRAHRRCRNSVSDALLQARFAGDELLQVKAGHAHGEFKTWVDKNCGFSYRTAASYMAISRRWPEIQEWQASKVKHAAPLSWSGFLRKPAGSKKESHRDQDSPNIDAIDQSKSEDPGGSSMGPVVPQPSVRVDKPGARELGEHRGSEGPAMTVMPLAAVDTSQPAGGQEATRIEILKVDRDEAEYSRLSTGDAPDGVVITEESRRQAEDLAFLVRRCPIRVQLAKVGNTQAFDADATLWRLTRGITDEVLARKLLAGREHGRYAPVIVDFLVARPPSEWMICPACAGTGQIKPDGEPCSGCFGGG